MYDLLIVVPYRDRREHLWQFAPWMETFLRGSYSFKLLVVEQTPGSPFNRGKLINVGYLTGLSDASYLVMHDVDMIPVDESCDYSPSLWPVHLAGRATQYDSQRPYEDYIGGVFLLSAAHFAQCNGMSNEFWGWGQEDDEFAERLRQIHTGWDKRDGLYRSLSHAPAEPQEANQRRRQAFWDGKYDRWSDGLSTAKFEIRGRQRLTDFLGLPLDAQHEIVTVDLLYPPPAT